MSDPRKSAGRPKRKQPSREEARFNIVLRGVFILLIVLMIVMTIIWRLATEGHSFQPFSY